MSGLPASPGAPSRTSGRGLARRLGWLLVILAGTAVYANALTGPFVEVDKIAIVRAENIRRLWPPIDVIRAWPGTPAWGRPLVAYSLAGNYALSGLSTWSYHLVNITLHVLTGLGLWAAVNRAMRSPLVSPTLRRSAGGLATAIALIWVVHPIHTAAVTHVSGRAQVMTGLAAVVLVLVVLRAAEQRGRSGWWQLTAVVVSAGGMLCSPAMVAVTLLALLADRAVGAGSFRGALRRRWAMYLGLAATWAIPIALSLAGLGPTGKLETYRVLEYGITQPGVVLHYLRLMIWPDPLVLQYHWRPATEMVEVLPGAVVMITLGALAIWLGRLSPVVSLMLGWIILTLLPSSSALPNAYMAIESRMYLPAMGVVALLVAGVWAGLRRVRWRDLASSGSLRGAAVVLVAVTSAALGARTLDRNRDYANPAELWLQAVQAGPYNATAANNLAWLYATSPDAEVRDGQSAIHLAEWAVKLSEGNPGFIDTLAAAHAEVGHFDKAVELMDVVLRLVPDHPRYQRARAEFQAHREAFLEGRPWREPAP